MIKLQKGNLYSIQGIKDEIYNDCKFVFGNYKIAAVDGQYFQIKFGRGLSELNEIWWDSEGFKIIEIK